MKLKLIVDSKIDWIDIDDVAPGSLIIGLHKQNHLGKDKLICTYEPNTYKWIVLRLLNSTEPAFYDTIQGIKQDYKNHNFYVVE